MFESKLVLSSFASEAFFEIRQTHAFVSYFLSHIFDVLRGIARVRSKRCGNGLQDLGANMGQALSGTPSEIVERVPLPEIFTGQYAHPRLHVSICPATPYVTN